MTLQNLINTSWFVPVCLMGLFVLVAFITGKYFPKRKEEYDNGNVFHKADSKDTLEVNDKIDDFMKSLNNYFYKSKETMTDSTFFPGQINRNQCKYSFNLPYIVTYPYLQIPVRENTVVVSLGTTSSYQDLIDDNVSSRSTDNLGDHFVPFLKINIPLKPIHPFMIVQKTPSILNLLKSKNNYLFGDKKLDQTYEFEFKSNKVSIHYPKKIMPLLKKLPSFHSIHFYKDLNLSIPFESIDMKNIYQIKELVNILFELSELPND